MKKKNQAPKKKRTARPAANKSGEKQKLNKNRDANVKNASQTTDLKSLPKKVSKVSEKKGEPRSTIGDYVHKAGQFFRESKMELKKVKWPTRKELLASTAVVVVLVLFCALFLGLVDFGLIKIIKIIMG